jgi:hypothetical protein
VFLNQNPWDIYSGGKRGLDLAISAYRLDEKAFPSRQVLASAGCDECPIGEEMTPELHLTPEALTFWTVGRYEHAAGDVNKLPMR